MSRTEHNNIEVKPRDESGTGAMRRARKEGLVPAVLYSRGKDNRLLYVDAKAWKILANHDHGLLKLTEGKKKTTVLVKEIQSSALKNQVLHIDFQEVKMDEKIHTTVPIYALPGDPVGLSEGGILEQPLHELEVFCLPADLPQSIEVDISGLGLEDNLTVADLELPKGVQAQTEPEHVIFHVLQQSVEEEETEGDAGEEAQEPSRVDEKQEQE